MSAGSHSSVAPRRQLGLASAIAAVAGETIAVGIFLTPAMMAKSLGSPFYLLLVWVIVGILTVCGALTYGELAARFPRAAREELHHAVSRSAMARSAARYVPELRADDLDGSFAGVRAQAVARDGSLVDDFVFSATERALHVRNAPSPAATSCLPLARLIVDRVPTMPRP